MALLPTGKGDITNPYAWEDLVGGASPPTEWNNSTVLTAAPADGYASSEDGRYWWMGDATSVTGGALAFIGDATLLTGTGVLVWQILQAATDGSVPQLQYSTDGGTTWTPVTIANAAGVQSQLQAGSVNVALTGGTGFAVQVVSSGGAPASNTTPWVIALAIVRDQYSVVPWDFPGAYNPISYNAQAVDQPVYRTLATLRTSMAIRLGFASQAANLPPGMTALINQFLFDAQSTLYRDYPALQTRRFFRWKVVPGIRFYSLKDNDEDVIAGLHLDPSKTIEWVGMQDTRNVWWPLVEGISPQLYTMIAKPWRPARYEIRQAIELYPAPNQTYWLWMKGHMGLKSFVNDTDQTTLDDELVYLRALANAKAHYGQSDAVVVDKDAKRLLGKIVGSTHGTTRYIPGTVEVPPAIRPSLIQFQNN